jgi:hypothetical protein
MNTKSDTSFLFTWPLAFEQPGLPADSQRYGHGLQPYVRLARQLVQEYDLPIPDEDHFVRIVRAALDARALLLQHAHYGQESMLLDLMLEDFIVFCLRPVAECQVF